MAIVFYPYTHPNKRFRTLREAHNYIDNSGLPWWTFHAPIGTFVVKEDTCNCRITLYTHFFPWQKENKKFQKRNPKRFIQNLN